MSLCDKCTDKQKKKIDENYEIIIQLLSLSHNDSVPRVIEHILFDISNCSQFHLNIASKAAFELISSGSKSKQGIFSREHPRSRSISAKEFVKKYKSQPLSKEEFYAFLDSEGIQIYLTKEEHSFLKKANCKSRNEIIQEYKRSIGDLIEFDEISKKKSDRRKRVYKKIRTVKIDELMF